MPSITSWMSRTALPQRRDDHERRPGSPIRFAAGAARQLGEFQGEDNGSPIIASWRAETAPDALPFGSNQTGHDYQRPA
jgi:hypothetical protein